MDTKSDLLSSYLSVSSAHTFLVAWVAALAHNVDSTRVVGLAG